MTKGEVDVAAPSAALAAERDQCVHMLAATLREATSALAALNVLQVESCTVAQTALCVRLSALNLTLHSQQEIRPISHSLSRELASALRTYRTLLRGSRLWIEMNHNTFQLATGLREYTAARSYSISY